MKGAEVRVIKKLLAVARAAHELADGTEEGDLIPFKRDYLKLCRALDALDKLPEMPSPYVGTGPAKAEYLLGLFESKNAMKAEGAK